MMQSMRFNRVLLVQPFYKGAHYEPHLPVGLGYIAEALKYAGINYDVLDMLLGYSIKDLKVKIESFKPNLVGFTMKTYMFENVYQIINQIKRLYPAVKTVAGGPHISTLRERVLEDCPGLDYGVVLEGEETIVELCQDKPLEQIKGLLFKNGDRIFYNGDRDFIKNLDSISYPTYDKFNLDRYLFSPKVPIPICSSRGCPYHCIYCPVAMAIGRKFRFRSPSNVVDEFVYWSNRGYHCFTFVDDNFTLLPQRVYEICEQIEEGGLSDLELNCYNGVRADRVDMPLLKRMKEVGFRLLSFGVEAGNNKVLKALKKSEDIQTIEKAIGVACQLNYEVVLYFLFGSPEETWQDLQDSIKLALRYPISNVDFFNIVPYPATELYDWLERNQYFVYQPKEYLNSETLRYKEPLFITPQMSLKERKRAIRLLKAVKRKVRRNYYARIFKNYPGLRWVIAQLATSWLVEEKLLVNYFLRRNLRRLKKKLLYG